MKCKFLTYAKRLSFLFKPVWKYGKSYIAISLISAAVIAPLAPITYVLLTQKVVDAIAIGMPFLNVVLLICVLYGANMGVWLIRTGIRELFLDIKKDKISFLINTDSYYRGIVTDYCYFDNPEFFDKYTWAASEYSSKSLALVDTICSIATAFTTVTVLVGMIASSGVVIIVLVVIQLVATTILEMKRSKINLKKREESIPFERKIGYVHKKMYSRECAQDVKTTNVKTFLMKMLKENADGVIKLRKKYIPAIFLNSFTNVLMAFITEGGIMIYICYGIMVTGTIQGAGMFLGMYYAAQNLVSNLQDFFSVWVSLNEFTLYAEKIEKFYNLPSLIEQPIDISKSKVCAIDNIPFSVELRNLSFSYPSSSFSIKNLNLKIGSGEKIAIVGENGAGKSTLAKLLLRLYDADDGDIFYNDHSIKNFDVHELREYIGMSFQEPQIYALPFKDNIFLYRYIDNNHISDLIKKSGLIDVLNKNNASFDTEMTREFDKEGIIMSGGEVQKISLARLMTAEYSKKFGLILLDEPSSALDPLAEYDLGNRILDQSNQTTTIIISHRLSLVTHADKIVVMSNGKIVEEGKHAELMDMKGLYYDMFSKQAENYSLPK